MTRTGKRKYNPTVIIIIITIIDRYGSDVINGTDDDNMYEPYCDDMNTFKTYKYISHTSNQWDGIEKSLQKIGTRRVKLIICIVCDNDSYRIKL